MLSNAKLLLSLAMASTALGLVSNSSSSVIVVPSSDATIAGNDTATPAPEPSSAAPIFYNSTATATQYEVVSEFTTYCPEPTTFVTNGATFTVTAPTTLTITNCPCTIEKPTSETSVSSTHDVETNSNAANARVIPGALGLAGAVMMLL
ncbi:CCQ_1a_G0015930.mRNA.1.CDS.1 [Saccharomyces cerevisiae]|nr:CCQ_1a_G0015930.mRNA.1.CDS.1 [Saccharomyces cerevisiae]CAI7263767.1 CCQ_1a_G0015930.mRNA.1.CDS.1 [Saccharomyces cerevisiae]